MRIIRDEKAATLTLVPAGAEEEKTIVAMIAVLKTDDPLLYGGRKDISNDDCDIALYAGGKKERQAETGKNVTVQREVQVGGIRLDLHGDTNDNRLEVNGLRNCCYLGNGTLIFLGQATVEGKVAMVITAGRCKHCNAGMIDSGRCEWQICYACAVKCEHKYVYGATHGGKQRIGRQDFCERCGLARSVIEGGQVSPAPATAAP